MLNDEVINYYMEFIRTRVGVYAFNTFFYGKVNDYKDVRRWTTNIDIATKTLIFVPIHVGNIHWICGIVYVQERRIEVYDSFNEDHSNVYKALRKYMTRELYDKNRTVVEEEAWTYFVNPDAPRQSGGVDCGVFVCQYIDFISRSTLPDFTQASIPSLREKMRQEIRAADTQAFVGIR
ncbi:cysteine proteinase [Ceratobasidium sp. AG-I]|nr:cysteine proteinase [Ceratobasidium sp. AG-I]